MKTKTSPSANTIAGLPAPLELFKPHVIQGLNSWERFALIGAKNIAYFIPELRQKEKKFSERIRSLSAAKKLFTAALKFSAECPGDYFVAEAKKFKNLSFGEWNTKVVENYPEFIQPTDEKDIKRPKKTTTFNICGWCQYANASRYINAHLLTGECLPLVAIENQISTEEVEKYSAHKKEQSGMLDGTVGFAHEMQFNTPCFLRFITADQCTVLLQNIENNLALIKAEREKFWAGINQLQTLVKEKDHARPWLPPARSGKSYASKGDKLVLFVPYGINDTAVLADMWVHAVWASGYRDTDGTVSGDAEVQIFEKREWNKDGKHFTFSTEAPILMLKSEFEYLHTIAQKPGFEKSQIRLDKNPDSVEDPDFKFVHVWLSSADFKNMSIDIAQFRKVLQKPVFAKA